MARRRFESWRESSKRMFKYTKVDMLTAFDGSNSVINHSRSGTWIETLVTLSASSPSIPLDKC